MHSMIRQIRAALVASLFVFAVACADTETGAENEAGAEDNSIMPSGEDPTGGAGDFGTGTGTTAPGSNEPVPVDSADTAGISTP